MAIDINCSLLKEISLMRDYFVPTKPVTNQDFALALAKIRDEISQLALPQMAYGAVLFHKDAFEIMIGGTIHRVSETPLAEWLRSYQHQNKVKVIAVSLAGEGDLSEIGSQLWLESDIVPILPGENMLPLAEQVSSIVSQFDKNGIAHLDINEQNEVCPSFLVSLSDYEKTCTEQEWAHLLDLVQQFSQKRLLFISATPRGGGVALMRHALIRLYRLLGVDAHWHILSENGDVFRVTKSKFHNVLQAVSDPATRLTEQDKKLFENWSRTNAQILEPAIQQADVIVIDDPQPSGLIPHIKTLNPNAKLLYRSHIQIESHLADEPGTPQHETWSYIWNFAKHADVFIGHPVDAFIPKSVPKETVVQMPPTTDPLDGLNKFLSEEHEAYYLKVFNAILLQGHQKPLDLQRPTVVQVARFDPSKGIPDVIESYRLLRRKLEADNTPFEKTPQLVIVGHGSIDDPDGQPLFNLTNDALQLPLYQPYASDIKVARVVHIDQLLNAILQHADVVLQLSHKEGFEIKVTEALLKGKPVISYRAGGIPLQIAENENGFVIDSPGDTEQVAQKMYQLFTDPALYSRMSQAAREKGRRDVLTVPNAIRWLELSV